MRSFELHPPWGSNPRPQGKEPCAPQTKLGGHCLSHFDSRWTLLAVPPPSKSKFKSKQTQNYQSQSWTEFGNCVRLRLHSIPSRLRPSPSELFFASRYFPLFGHDSAAVGCIFDQPRARAAQAEIGEMLRPRALLGEQYAPHPPSL